MFMKDLEQLSKRTKSCNLCSFNNGRIQLTGVGKPSHVMFIAESPSTSVKKGNQKTSINFYNTDADKLFEEVRLKCGLQDSYLTDFVKCGVASGKPTYETIDKDHGRIEIRRYSLSTQIDWLEQKPDWAGLSAVGCVESTRIVGEKTSVENRYYLCSITDLTRFSEGVRLHWSIENQQHWVLDVQFGEDRNRARKDHSAENLALIRRVALNLFNKNGPAKDSLRRRKLRVCLSDSYRAKLLGIT